MSLTSIYESHSEIKRGDPLAWIVKAERIDMVGCALTTLLQLLTLVSRALPAWLPRSPLPVSSVNSIRWGAAAFNLYEHAIVNPRKRYLSTSNTPPSSAIKTVKWQESLCLVAMVHRIKEGGAASYLQDRR